MKPHSRFISVLGWAALTVQFALAQQTSVDLRRLTFEVVWNTVNERHFDPNLNGVDWISVRQKYAPRVAVAKSDDEFYALLNEMLRELKQSHFAVIPPRFYLAEEKGEGRSSRAEVGITAQVVDGRPTITRVERGSPAARARLRTGFVITHIDDSSLDELQQRVAGRSERLVARHSLLLRAVRSRLRGKAGTTLTLRYLDERGRARVVTLRREAPDQIVKFGDLPTPLARIESGRLKQRIGYLRFNLFLLPLLAEIRETVKSFHDAPGIILDLRCNSGGEIAVTTVLAGMFYTERTSLGVTRLRKGELYRPVFPQPHAYTAPLVILTDEGTASAAETFAAAMQENGRAVIVGRPTVGGALPSIIEELPTGARLQYAIGEYRTPRGIVIEGQGVRPDILVELTRNELLAGRDSILEKAVSVILGTERK